jgi:hypothetical protein
MVLNSGTGITDPVDLLDKLTEVVTSRNLTAVAVDGGGTGHAIGDIIQIDATGSTSTIVAQLEVTSVAAGVIDGIRVYRGGAYTVDPTDVLTNAQSGTSGGGTGATFVLTFSAASWSVNRRTQQALSATIANGGTGYTVNDKITLTLALPGVQGHNGVDAIFNVDSEAGGVVTGVSVDTVGNYEEVMTNPVAVTGGTGGDDCTLTVTWEDATFAENEGQVCMLEGSGLAGADSIHVVIKTYTEANGFDTAYNWGLLGTQGYNAAVPIQNQQGINTVQMDTGTGDFASDTVGAYLILKNNDADPDMEWWIKHDGRHITMFVKVESATTTLYSECYLGFLNQTATNSEYPYPLWICGCTEDRNRIWSDNTQLTGGLTEVLSLAAANTNTNPTGPGYLLQPDGTWQAYASAKTSSTGTSRLVEDEFGIFPFIDRNTVTNPGIVASATSDVQFVGTGDDFIPNTGVPGTQNLLLKPTPGSGDDYYWLVAPIIVRLDSYPTLWNMWGEIADIFWFHTGNNSIVSEDRFVLGTKRYLIFQNGTQTENWSYLALDED